MKFGVTMMGLSPRYYAEVAAAAEEAGFESVWIPEHLVFPDDMAAQYLYSDSGLPPTPSSTPLYDPWVALGYIAAATSSIRLATHVYILPLRHPFITGRSVVTLDRLSGGRVTLGIGVGWLEAEFRMLGEGWENRGKRTDEIIEILQRLWSEPVIEHHGDAYDFEPVRFEPKPLQRSGIPIEVGGASKPALRRAGRLGDGWIEIGSHSLDELVPLIDVVQGHRAEAGRSELPFEISTGTGVAAADASAPTRAEIDEAAGVGVTRLIASLPWTDPNAGIRPDDAKEFLADFGRNVIGR